MSKRIESQNTIINCKSEKIYHFLGDFTNFTPLLPEQVANWQSNADTCSFEVKGMATLGLRITGRTPYTKISMVGEGRLPFGFTIETSIRETGPLQCQVLLVIDADMNPFIAMMAEKPLQNFVDMLLPRLKEEMEKN